MNKMRNWMLGLTVVSLLAVGVVAVAGNGFGGNGMNRLGQEQRSGACALEGKVGGANGISNSEIGDEVCPGEGARFDQRQGHGRRQSTGRPLDGSGYGMHQGSGQGEPGCGGDCDGSCQ